MNLEDLTTRVDQQLALGPSTRNKNGLVLAVRLVNNDVLIEVLREGGIRDEVWKAVAPGDVVAVGVASTGWMSPIEPTVPHKSQNRRRMYMTTLLNDEGDLSIMRVANDQPRQLRNGTGILHDGLRELWTKRGQFNAQ